MAWGRCRMEATCCGQCGCGAGFSLEELAARMGVTTRTLRRWEQAEVWPSPTFLHALCQTLNAHEEERTALTMGSLAPLGDSRSVSPDAVREQIAALRLPPATPEEQGLRDLRLLAMEARTWPFASSSAVMRQMLAEVYVLHARLFSDRGQHKEMTAYALRALDLMPTGQVKDAVWLKAAIFAAHAVAVKGGQLLPQRGLDYFRQLLPLAQTPKVECWILAWMGELQIAAGAVESAFVTMERSCRVAEQCEDATMPLQRRVDYANLLLQAGHSAKAIPLVQFEGTADPYFRVRHFLAAAKAYLGVNDRAAAQHSLDRAVGDIKAFHMTNYQLLADAIARQL